MREVRVIAFALLAACGGREAEVAEPSARSSVRVVRCVPAPPPPMISSVGLRVDPLGTSRELARLRLRGQDARDAFAVPDAVTIDLVVIVGGGLSRDTVKRDLTTAVPKLEACLAKNTATVLMPTLATVAFDVESDGSLTKVSATGANVALRSCIGDVIRGHRLPASASAGRVSVHLQFDPAGLVKPEPAEQVAPVDVEPWTPFAIDMAEPVDSAGRIARGLEIAARRQGDALDRCFAGTSATGSLRAMLELDAHGRVVASRVGGLGDRTIETCVGEAFVDLSVATSAADAVEVACDLSRGDAAPWRATAEAGYQVIHASRTKVTHDTTTLPAEEADPESLRGGETYLVIVEPDTPGMLLDRALSWAHEGDATLVAMRVSSGPPVLLGAGRSIYSVVADGAGDPNARGLTVVVGSKAVATCERTPRRRGTTTTTADAALSDPRAVSLLIGELAAGCRSTACSATLGIAIEKTTAARDLVEVVSAARRHGFERVMLGSGGCTSTSATIDALDD